MNFNEPAKNLKNKRFKTNKKNEEILWTKHAKEKMRYYRFSQKRVMRILRKPDRREEGIVLGTIAHMQVAGTKKHPGEVWMMYQIVKSKAKNQKPTLIKQTKSINDEKPQGASKRIKIISAWRYPGRTPENQRPIIPEDTLENLKAEQ